MKSGAAAASLGVEDLGAPWIVTDTKSMSKDPRRLGLMSAVGEHSGSGKSNGGKHAASSLDVACLL